MWVNLSKMIKRLSDDPDIRAIFITAVGDKAFTAGLDVQVRDPISDPASVCILHSDLSPHRLPLKVKLLAAGATRHA